MKNLSKFIKPIAENETKFIFFSGKGGVGKSTMSCSTAVWLANQGYKTLLVTTDPAPNLSDIFDQEIGHRVTKINNIQNLSAIEIDPDVASQEYREKIMAPMRKLLDEKDIKIVNEQLNSPCVEEIAAFDKFIEFMDKPDYDVVIFDTAPTGHTIRLLELPSGWNESLKGDSATCIGPSASLQDAKARYEKAISYLQDEQKTSFVFVLKPENSSVLEVERSSGELEKLGINTTFSIVNGLLPNNAITDEFLKKRKEQENAVIENIKNSFKTPLFFYPLKDSEVSGLKLLESVGDFLYEGKEEENSEPKQITKETEVTFDNNLKEILPVLTPLRDKRYVFFTGKGGVGKSTVACTTSVYMAEKGLKTLIVTTDPASHLHDIFGQEINHEPTKIRAVDNLFAARIDQKKALEEYKKRILEAVKDKDEETKKSVEEDLNSPCAEEMAAFEKFMSYFEIEGYEVIIFDTAPTGHTLRLLELPSDWKGFVDLGTLTKNTSGETMSKYSNVIDTMRNKDKSSFIFVMYPEYTPIIEAWRASEDLKKQVGIETAAVAVNNLISPHWGQNSFFNNRRIQQSKYLQLIKEKFEIPSIFISLQEDEPKGIDNLKRLGKNIFGGQK
ncbi:MAG: arsenical pump-driving ATPase [Candidatus Pacearchaeota archaeon]